VRKKEKRDGNTEVTEDSGEEEPQDPGTHTVPGVDGTR